MPCYFLPPFHEYFVISGRWEGDNERKYALGHAG